MDKIIIKDMSVYAYHGCNSEEKSMGQKFIISAELGIDLLEASLFDKIEKTVNYSRLCATIEKVVRENRFDLIERCAGAVAEEILNKYKDVSYADITVKKPWAPIDSELKYVAVNIKRSRHKAYLGIGSNMGDRRKYIDESVKKLDSNGICVKKLSSIIETEPWGNTDQDKFLNCALEIETTLSPASLLSRIQEIENSLGREREIHWGPRTIDIDILFYDSEILNSENLVVPHPYFEKRDFALIPMREIAPYYIHPILNKRIMDIKLEQEM